MTAELTVFRVQDAKGRGPFKPGVSHRWIDEDSTTDLPAYFEEFGDVTRILGRPGEHFGCAVRTPDGIRRWFSPTERHRLQRLGYRVVSLQADRILAESPNQLVFARRTPLHKRVTLIPWGAL